jgi:hypothetical protein
MSMNEFSIRFLDALRAAKNRTVRALAETAVESHGGMRIDGTSPAGHLFYVTTEGGCEVTVGLGQHWHAHFAEFRVGDGSEQPFEAVIRFLGSLVRDQVTIVEWYCGPRHLGSRVMQPGWDTHGFKGANRCEILSWAGTHDDETTSG